jgi:hypothetical protein
MTLMPNKWMHTKRRPASPLDAGRQFERAVHAQACLPGGGRSPFRSATIMKAINLLAACALLMVSGG